MTGIKLLSSPLTFTFLCAIEYKKLNMSRKDFEIPLALF